jgi:hypothetical protein
MRNSVPKHGLQTIKCRRARAQQPALPGGRFGADAALEKLDGDNPLHDQFEIEAECFETLFFETSLQAPPSM